MAVPQDGKNAESHAFEGHGDKEERSVQRDCAREHDDDDSLDGCRPTRRHLPGPKEDFATLTDVEYASFLQAKLAEIKQDHTESLVQIEQNKTEQMSKICKDSVANDEEQQHGDAPSDDLNAIFAIIDVLNENNQELCRQNEELCDEIQEIKNDNLKLLEQATQLCAGCADLRLEIDAAKTRQVQLKQAEAFLVNCIQEYQKEYEHWDQQRSRMQGSPVSDNWGRR